MNGNQGKSHGPTSGSDERKPKDDPSPAVTWWTVRQKKMRAAEAEDSRLAALDRAERDQRIARDYRNPVAVWVGLVVVLLLVLGGWFIVDAMRCDPLTSDSGLVRSRDCR